MYEMKDSGVTWINAIPQAWELKKIKYTLQSRNENNNPIRSKEILSLTAKQGVVPIDEKVGGGNKPKEDYSAYKLAHPGDIVMNSMNILSGSVGLSKYFGCVSPVYYMLRPHNENDDVRFFNYIFQTTVFQKSLLGLGNGILIKESDNGKLNTIRMRISLDKFGNLYIPVPDSNTQKEIANYLDKTIPEIDALSKDIEQQIVTLEEYKKSVITEAVTKGLDPNVEMKDSGIEWIGMMPKEWMVVPTKYYFTIGNGSDPLTTDGDTPVFGSGLKSFKTCKEYKKGPTVLLGRKGTINIPQYIDTKYWNVDTAFDVKEKAGYKLKLFYYASTCFDYENYSTQTALPSMTMATYNNFRLPYMPLSVQDEIIKYLDSKCFEIDAAISAKNEQLAVLEEYKKSLIYEYVTGKKEVPTDE